MRSRFLLGVGLCAAASEFVVALHAHADALSCRYEVQQETVLDRVTKLTWQQTTGGTSTYDEAVKHCNNLGGGFRLPTVKELQSLVDVTRTSPTIDSSAFPGLPVGSYPHWTSTMRAADEADAWYVNFADGTVFFLPKTTSMSVRCVKGP